MKVLSDAWNGFNNENAVKCKMCSASLPYTYYYNENTIGRVHSQRKLCVLTRAVEFICAVVFICIDSSCVYA